MEGGKCGIIKFTEQESLILTIKQWTWMQGHLDLQKKDWTGWDNHGQEILTFKGSGIIGNCFLCHYYLSCLGCPLLGANARCDTYWGWINGDEEARKKLASNIIEKCEDRLKELTHNV